MSDPNDPATLTTERLILRPLVLADAPDVYAYAGQPAVSRFLSWTPHRSVADSEAFIRSVQDGYAEDTSTTRAIVVEDEQPQRVVGTISFLSYTHAHNYADVGYLLAPEYWGRGLATEALKALIAHGFASQGLNRIEAQVRVGNEVSAHVLEKAGLEREALLHQRFNIAGEYHDSYLYALLRENWRETSQDQGR